MADFSMLMSVPRLVEAVGGICLNNNSEVSGFSSVATDSRNVVPRSLFVPLRGEFQDGHIYIKNAVVAGASVIFVDSEYERSSSNILSALWGSHPVVFIMVENTLRALQDAAGAYVSFFPDLLKIGITGSSGKTTTKEIIASIFSRKYSVVMNEGNLNSETGLPLSVFKIRKEHEAGIFELGMNRRGEIAEIAKVLLPSLALITNVGTAHIGILGTSQAIADEKKAIFSFFNDNCAGFIPEDDPRRDYLSQIAAGSIHTFGPNTTAGYEGFENLGIDGTLIRYEGLGIHFSLPGFFNLKNALAAITLSRYAGLSPSLIKAGIELVKPLFGRTEILRGEITILLDCYNANPESMESALELCRTLEWNGKKIIVLGSMLELGQESVASHRKICGLASESGADSIFLFGEDIVHAGQTIEWKNIEPGYFTDIDELSSALLKTVQKGDLVFLKGSRGMALERVCPVLGFSEKPEGHHE